MAIEGENAIARYRELMGPTDSRKAPAGHHPGRSTAPTSRRTPCTGSDGPDTAKFEIGYFFTGADLL